MKDVTVSTRDGELLSLAGALLVYRGSRRVFVTVHGVARNERGPCELTSGEPATQASAAKLLAGLELGLSFRGLVPERLLAIAPGMMAWWCPPARRTVWFACTDKAGAAIGSRHGTTAHPSLVFAAAEGRWYVFAVKGEKRPTAETRLYRAPYFNVWADRGEICTGNVRLPNAASPEAIAVYERAFFESRFTHPNPGFRVRTKGGGFALWKELLSARGRKPFPERALYPTQFTLAQFVRELTEEE